MLRGRNPRFHGPEPAAVEGRAGEAQFDALAEEVLDTPVRSWADVVTRAEIAQAYSPNFPESLKDRALKELLAAVLAMGGRHA